MYNRITFNYDGIITKGILLAECDFIETISVPVEKKFLFFKYYSKGTDKRKFKMYIVFIPWKHQLKELLEVDEKYIINPQSFNADETWITKDKFISETYDGYIYPSSLEVKDFVGYKFIYDNNSFIANLCLHEFEDCLTILYKNMPEVLDIELGNIEE